jgi:hypothetical protein
LSLLGLSNSNLTNSTPISEIKINNTNEVIEGSSEKKIINDFNNETGNLNGKKKNVF